MMQEEGYFAEAAVDHGLKQTPSVEVDFSGATAFIRQHLLCHQGIRDHGSFRWIIIDALLISTSSCSLDCQPAERQSHPEGML